MSHPFLWLAGFYMLDRLNRQSRELRDHAGRLRDLKAAQLSVAPDVKNEVAGRDTTQTTGGCLTALMMVCVVLPCCIALLLALVWFLLATTTGHCLLALCGILLPLAKYRVKRG